MNQNAARIYGNQQVNTASPAKMVQMLYDKMIASLREAILAIEKGDIQARCDATTKTHELIAHLSDTLDMESGGEIARNLENLYLFSLRHLMAVDRYNDPKPAQDVIDLMIPLRDSWKELADKSEGEMRIAIQAAQTARPQPTPAPQSAAKNTSDDDTDTKPRSGGFSISA
ncbi:MAG: flagellar export chaperone FliS [Pseudomonadota bacterium]